MKTVWVLILRLVMLILFGFLVFAGIDSLTLVQVTYLAMAITAANYLIGDLLLKKNAGSVSVSALKGLVAAATAYIFSFIFSGFFISIPPMIIFGIIIAAGEFLLFQFVPSARGARA